MKSLNAIGHKLSYPETQMQVLENGSHGSFDERLSEVGFHPLKADTVEILQINVGKMCNQVCAHCHVDAGPDRKEIMLRETFDQCLAAIDHANIKVVDLTGGAPEMNPHFRWFVRELHSRGIHIIVRCNLTIILANPKYYDLPDFFRDNKVEVVSSLPHFSRLRTDAQRGAGVFDKSIVALKKLNAVGYGVDGTGLHLNLVFNPSGAFLPPSQTSLERDFKERLLRQHDVVFNNLFAITNIPINRFLDYLINTGNYETYMNELINGFNPASIEGLMCRNMVSVGWDGNLFDCDFNQMLELEIENIPHIKDFDKDLLNNRMIRTGNHCFGCTAGAGSSCGGEIV